MFETDKVKKWQPRECPIFLHPIPLRTMFILKPKKDNFSVNHEGHGGALEESHNFLALMTPE